MTTDTADHAFAYALRAVANDGHVSAASPELQGACERGVAAGLLVEVPVVGPQRTWIAAK